MSQNRNYLSTEILSLISAFAILALAGFVTLRADEYRRDTGASLRHTITVENALHRLYGAIRGIESDERGYLITHDIRYLEFNKDAIDQIVKDLNIVSALISADKAQSARLAELRPLLSERLRVLSIRRELIQKEEFDKAIAIIKSGSDRSLMKQVDSIIWQMIADEEKSYRQRDFSYRTAVEQLQNAIASMILVVVGVTIFAIWQAQRQMLALQESRDSVKFAYEKLLEETNKRQSVEAQLRQSQKLDSLGQLAGGIAHDFNNMLGVIVASLNILRRKLDKIEGDYTSYIDSALLSADNASELIRRLLAFSRIQPLAPQALDANLFVSQMSDMLIRSIGYGIKLIVTLDDKLWPTKADANELQNAILNLAVNARDAMPEGGNLMITTKNCVIGKTDHLLLVDLPIGDYVVLEIEDTGKGMPPDVAAKAFDPFYTTKEVGKGSGLGLSQVHGFVKQSGGNVRIISEVDKGTKIEMYLPRYVP
jgi:signal transduction histidine kinase